MLFSTFNVLAQSSLVSTKNLDENEFVNEAYHWNDHLFVFTNNGKARKVSIYCFNSKGDQMWKEQISYSSDHYLSGIYHTLIPANENLLYTYYSYGKTAFYTLNEKGMKNTSPLGKSQAKNRTVQKYHQNGKYFVIQSNVKKQFFLTDFNEKGNYSNTKDLALSSVKNVEWKFLGLNNNNSIYFYGIKPGYTDNGSVECVFETIGAKDAKKANHNYDLKLDQGKFPSPSWTDEGGVMDDFAHILYSEKENAMYAYGLYQSTKKSKKTGLAADKIKHEGVFIHKLNMDGTLMYRNQYSFQELGFTVDEMINKEIQLDLQNNTGDLLIGILENHKFTTLKKKAYLVFINKEDGSVTGKFFTREYENVESVSDRKIKFDSDLPNSNQMLSNLYKGINNKSEIDWVKNLSEIISTIPAKELFNNHKLFVFPGNQSTTVINFDNSGKIPVLKFYNL